MKIKDFSTIVNAIVYLTFIGVFIVILKALLD
jgi:hypothetical protein